MTDGNLDPALPATPAAAPRSDGLARFLEPNPVMLAVIWLFVVSHFVSTWSTIGTVFNDTDDAMRLVEVRDFLAGQGWFDLHQYRLDPPADLPMHWSRLIDLPIAVLIRLAELVVAPATAEKFAMYLWPPLVLIPALLAVRRIACRLGGDWAALPALYLTATCSPVIGQFVPGRIDHHNVQITATLLLFAVAFDPPSPRRGLLMALISTATMAVGMEALPYIAIAGIPIALRWVMEGSHDEARAYGFGLAGGALVAMVGTIPRNLWLWGACDALSANFVGLAVAGGLALGAVALIGPTGRAARLGLLGIAGVVAVVGYALPEPLCLRGPFAQILPEVGAVWLYGVTELQPWRSFYSAHHVDALVALLVPLLAAASVVYLAREPATRRSPVFWSLAFCAGVAITIGLGQIRTIVYGDMLSLPFIAAAIGRLASRSAARGRTATVTVLIGTVLASSSLATWVIGRLAPAAWKTEEAIMTAGAIGSGPETAASPTGANVGSPCMTLTNYAKLAALPPGLVGAEINLGPSILAATPHSVVTAPYHRMQRGILDGDRMFRRKPEEALKIMDARRLDYVALCTASASGLAAEESEPDSLFVALMKGRAPARLEEIGGGGVIRVWRLLPATAYADGGSATLTGR